MLKHRSRQLSLQEKRTIKLGLCALAVFIVLELLPVPDPTLEKSNERKRAVIAAAASDQEPSDLRPPSPPRLAHPTQQNVDTLSQHGKEASKALKSGQLAPSDEALSLTTWLSKGGRVGWCNSKLADHAVHCRPVACLHSTTGARIDLTTKPFTVLPKSSPLACMEPLGGQRPHAHGAAARRPTVSFIMATHNNDALAAKALLELWRTAQASARHGGGAWDGMGAGRGGVGWGGEWKGAINAWDSGSPHRQVPDKGARRHGMGSDRA